MDAQVALVVVVFLPAAHLKELLVDHRVLPEVHLVLLVLLRLKEPLVVHLTQHHQLKALNKVHLTVTLLVPSMVHSKVH